MKLRSLGNVLWNRRWIVASVIALELLLSPFLIKFTHPTYEATANIAYVDLGTNSLFPPGDLPNLVLSTAVMQRVNDQLHLNADLDSLRAHTKAKVTPRSNVLPISFRSTRPGDALKLANAIADATVYEYKNMGVRQYDDVINAIDAQLASQQSKIRFFDAQLQKAVQHDSFVGSPQALETISTRLDDLESQKAQANATYVADQGAASTLGNGNPQSDRSGIASVIREQILASDPLYQAVRTGESKDLAEYEAERAGYTDAFPGLAGLKEKVARESQAVDRTASATVANHPGASQTYGNLLMAQRTAAAQVAGDHAKVEAIDREISTTRARLVDLPRYGVTANQLRLQRDSAATAYGQLQGRLQVTLADKAQAGALGALIVLDHATAALPRIPRSTLTFMIAALIIALALGAAFAAEALDPRVRTATDVETLYGSPHIGTI